MFSLKQSTLYFIGKQIEWDTTVKRIMKDNSIHITKIERYQNGEQVHFWTTESEMKDGRCKDGKS
jgi:hypothetical protein